jgi:hypothetical protein
VTFSAFDSFEPLPTSQNKSECPSENLLNRENRL